MLRLECWFNIHRRVEYFEVSNIYQVISFMQTRKEDERKKIINYLWIVKMYLTALLLYRNDN